MEHQPPPNPGENMDGEKFDRHNPDHWAKKIKKEGIMMLRYPAPENMGYIGHDLDSSKKFPRASTQKLIIDSVYDNYKSMCLMNNSDPKANRYLIISSEVHWGKDKGKILLQYDCFRPKVSMSRSGKSEESKDEFGRNLVNISWFTFIKKSEIEHFVESDADLIENTFRIICGPGLKAMGFQIRKPEKLIIIDEDTKGLLPFSKGNPKITEREFSVAIGNTRFP